MPGSMKILTAVAIITASFSSLAEADQLYVFVRLQCIPALHHLEVDTFKAWNVCNDGCPEPGRLVSEGIYEQQHFIDKFLKKPYSCDLGTGQKAVLTILNHFPGRGIPVMTFDVKVEGTEVTPPERSDGEEDLDIQIAAIPRPSDPSGKAATVPAEVDANSCWASKIQFSLPDEIGCNRIKLHSDIYGPLKQEESAQYMKSPR